MKIALCLSGQPRELHEGFSYWKKNLLDRHNVDVFIHSWNSKYNIEILDLYFPKKHTFEDYRFSPEHDRIYADNCIHHTSLPRYSLSQFYSILQSRNLKISCEEKHNMKYDWVIRGRFDYALNRTFEFDKLERSYIYIPIRKYLRPDKTYDNKFCDMFAFGSSENMDKYMSGFEHINDYAKRPGYKFYGENILSTTLIEAGVRNSHEYPAREGEMIQYLDMDDPFVTEEATRGHWIHSLIRRTTEERNYWLNHDLDYWRSNNVK